MLRMAVEKSKDVAITGEQILGSQPIAGHAP